MAPWNPQIWVISRNPQSSSVEWKLGILSGLASISLGAALLAGEQTQRRAWFRSQCHFILPYCFSFCGESLMEDSSIHKYYNYF